MKTRGKVKGDTWNVDYAKEGADSRDLLDDGADANGYSEDKTDDGIPPRSEPRTGRGGGNKRPGRMPRVGGPKARSDRNAVDAAEFRDVVQGFFDFIEELNKAGRKKPDKRRVANEIKAARIVEEPKTKKMVKFDAEPTPAQSSEKFELQPDAFPGGSKTDKLYRYKEEDHNTGKELLTIFKDQNKEPGTVFPGNLAQAQVQEAKAQRETETTRREAQPMMDLNSKYPHLQQFPGGNVQSYNIMKQQQQQQPTKQQLQQQQQQQQQQQAANLYGGFDFPNNPMYADVVQRLRMQQQQAFDKNPMSNYFMPPYDNYQKMFHNELLNLQLLELLQKPLGSVPPHGAAALFENLSREFSIMNPMEMASQQQQQQQQQQQRYPNQSMGMELMRDGSTAMNPRSLEGKLGRAATHVAIAYFIYFKSDPESMNKTDKTKMDPTYNARMLKEKKHDTYPNESLETYLAQNMPKMNNNPYDYLGNAGLQRLMAQGNPDQLRELQLQRMQQEAMLRNEELLQLRNAAAYQNQAAAKNEAKMEEEVQKRRQEENRGRPQQQQVKTQPKEEEIIEIKENSEGEEASQQPPKVEQKNKATTEKASLDQSELLKGKSEDNPISAEDIVEEITELTGLGQDKKGAQSRKNTINTNNSASPAPANKPPVSKETGEISKPEVQEVAAQKPIETNAEVSATQNVTTTKESAQPEQAKSSQVIEIDEAPAEEVAPKESSKPVESPQKDEKQ